MIQWRFELLNYLVKKCGYERYLEIGVEDGDCFRRIECKTKHGVDPASKHATHPITSDLFFYQLPSDIKYDLIFIDGLHVDEQVYKDIKNSLNHLAPNGTIVMHDCNPPTEWHQRSQYEASKNGYRLWNGTTWKAFMSIRQECPDLDMWVIDMDWGCGVIRNKSKSESLRQNKAIQIPVELRYEDLEKNRKEWLNLIKVGEFMNLINNS